MYEFLYGIGSEQGNEKITFEGGIHVQNKEEIIVES
jgi:hypothetical protein